MRLKEIRISKGMTQKTLAGLLGISQQRVWQYEIGRCEPSLAMLRKMASVLGCTIDELVA